MADNDHAAEPKEAYEKVQFLRTHDVPRRILGHESTLTDFAKRLGLSREALRDQVTRRVLPSKTQSVMASKLKFRLDWREWSSGAAADFQDRYLKEHGSPRSSAEPPQSSSSATPPPLPVDRTPTEADICGVSERILVAGLRLPEGVSADLLVKERSTEPHVAFSFPYAGPLGVLLVLLLTPMVADQWARTLGVSFAAPLALLLAVSALALTFLYSHYLGMLGASVEPVGSPERQGYDTLRQNLATGGRAVHLYSRWLTAFLDAVDRFFGDAGMADRTLFPRAFGLGTPAPLWTAPAFDRCLFLAFLYPMASIFIMWAVSGHVGPAEDALGLQSGLPGWLRGLVVAPLGFGAFAWWRFIHNRSGRVRAFWLFVVFAIAFAVAVAFAVALTIAITGAITSAITDAITQAAAIAFAGAVAFAFAFAVAGIGAVVGAVTGTIGSASAFAFVVAFAGADAFDFAVAVAGIVAGAGVVAGAGAVHWVSNTGIGKRWRGAFLLLFFVAMISGCLMAAHSLSSWPGWGLSGPFLLFLGLLTLLNAPFDWASLGLTRALLRRGLELKNWWPFLLALVDALFAAGIVALLALAMVIGVQTFDALVVHGGGEPLLPLGPLFDGIATRPEAPEFWWVYVLLLSTMIPSLINLVIGGTALACAVPGLSPWLLDYLPAARAVRTYHRAWIAAVLTGRVGLGVIIGMAVQTILAYGLIFYAMPAVGLGLLDVARDIAAPDLPMRLIQLLAGSS
jgi:hypothetical protein